MAAQDPESHAANDHAMLTTALHPISCSQKFHAFQRPKQRLASDSLREEKYRVKEEAGVNNHSPKTVSVKDYCRTPSYCGVTFTACSDAKIKLVVNAAAKCKAGCQRMVVVKVSEP